jgi:hypothetical protein
VLRLLLLPLGLQHEVSRPGSLEAKMGVKWGGGAQSRAHEDEEKP